MWINVSDLPVTCVLLPLMTTIRQAEPENPLWHSWKSHCDQSSPEVERDSGLAKEIVRELSREKKEFSIRKRTKIYKHISHMICNHKIVQTFFPCFYNWKHVCRGSLLKFETLSCEVSQLPDSQQVELEVRGIKADVKEMTIDWDKYPRRCPFCEIRCLCLWCRKLYAWYSAIRLACNLQKLGYNSKWLQLSSHLQQPLPSSYRVSRQEINVEVWSLFYWFTKHTFRILASFKTL